MKYNENIKMSLIAKKFGINKENLRNYIWYYT